MVLCVIAYHADDEGLCSYPGLPLICQESKISERGVRYALRDLEKLGEVTTTVGRGKGHVTTYSINLPISSEKEPKGATVAPFPSQQKGQNGADKGQSMPLSPDQKGQMATDPLDVKGANCSSKGAIRSAKGANGDAHIGRTVLTVMNRNTQTCASEPETAIETPAAIWESIFREKPGIFTGERIAEAGIADLAVWRETLTMWWTNQYSRRNLTRIIEVYREKLKAKQEGNGNGKGNHAATPTPVRETHNQREARRTLELLRGIREQGRSDNHADPDDTAPTGITIDHRR